jgi:hypothetical protein
MYDLIIHNCHTLTINDDGIVNIERNQDIIVDEGKIVTIQPSDRDATAGQTREVIEAKEMLAMPGLINTHAHVPMVIFRGGRCGGASWYPSLTACEGYLSENVLSVGSFVLINLVHLYQLAFDKCRGLFVQQKWDACPMLFLLEYVNLVLMRSMHTWAWKIYICISPNSNAKKRKENDIC